MLFFIGFPASMHQELLKDVVKSIPNELIGGIPANGKGYTKQYIEDCLDSLIAFRSGRPKCFEKGLVVMAFKDFGSPGIAQLSSNFYPFAILKELTIDRRLAATGTQAARDKNEIVRDAIAAAKKSLKLRNQVCNYLTSRSNRTPYLLPIRHFGDAAIANLVRRAWIVLQQQDDATALLENLAKDFEKEHPFTKKRGAAGYFLNAKGVAFRSPGRHLHGIAHPNLVGHDDQCFLNGSLRVGGQILQGFHYDCTVSGGNYAATVSNCHDEEVTKVGNPHLNVYPNDFIR